MPFYVYAWIANACLGLGAISGKLTAKHQIKNPWLFNFVWSLIITVLTLPFALAAHPGMPTHWGQLWLMGFFSMAAGALYIFSLYAVDISVLGPMYTLRIVINTILGFLLFHERFAGFQIGLMVLILIGGVLITIDERFSTKSFFNRSIVLVLITVTMSALYGATIKYAMQFEGYWVVTMWGNILAQILLIPTIWFFWRDLRKVRLHEWSGVVGIGVFSTIASAAQNAAYAVNIGITTAILSAPSSMILAIILSLFMPKLLEKHTIKIYAIRFTAAAIMVVAALRLSS